MGPQLQGTTQEQVDQFMQLFKDKSISKEQLTTFIPLEVEFVRCLCSALKSEINACKNEFAVCMKEFDRIFDIIDKMCVNDKITLEERHELIDLLDQISNKMIELKKDHDKSTIKKMLIVATAILIAPVVAGVTCQVVRNANH